MIISTNISTTTCRQHIRTTYSHSLLIDMTELTSRINQPFSSDHGPRCPASRPLLALLDIFSSVNTSDRQGHSRNSPERLDIVTRKKYFPNPLQFDLMFNTKTLQSLSAIEEILSVRETDDHARRGISGLRTQNLQIHRHILCMHHDIILLRTFSFLLIFSLSLLSDVDVVLTPQ